MKTFRSAVIAGSLVAIGGVAQASTVNLVTNGDFESGNTGFTTDYSESVGLSGSSTYVVTTNPASNNGSFQSFGDNTSGSGNGLLAALAALTRWERSPPSAYSRTMFSCSVWTNQST